MICEDLREKRSRVRSLAAFSRGVADGYHRRKSLKTRSLALVLACGLAASMVLYPSSSPAQVMSGTVGLLGFGPGWYSGVTRVTQFIVERAGVTEMANVALTATMRGGLAGAVIMGMVLAEPAFDSGVDAIRTYLASLSGAGFTLTGGTLQWAPGTVWTPIAGTAVATEWAGDKGGAGVSGCGTGGRVCNYVLNGSQSGAGTACNAFCQNAEGGNCGSCSYVPSVTTVSCQAGCVVSNPGAGTITYNEYFYPNSGYTSQVQSSVPPPAPATIGQVTTQITQDLTNSVAAAKSAADEAEQILTWGIPGAVANASATPKVQDGEGVASGAIVDMVIPATPTTGATSAAMEAANVAAANLPSGGAITSTPPAAGTSTSTAAQEPYTDPSFSGSLSTVPWATPSDFGARWSTFASGVQSTGLFGLWGNAFGSPGSGGSSTYTFNAGSLGTHTYDFSSWGSTVFGLLSGLVQITCGFVAVKIATIKGG